MRSFRRKNNFHDTYAFFEEKKSSSKTTTKKDKVDLEITKKEGKVDSDKK